MPLEEVRKCFEEFKQIDTSSLADLRWDRNTEARENDLEGELVFRVASLPCWFGGVWHCLKGVLSRCWVASCSERQGEV